MINLIKITQLQRTLQHDYRTLRKLVLDSDPERSTQLTLRKLSRDIDETCKLLDDLTKQLHELNKK